MNRRAGVLLAELAVGALVCIAAACGGSPSPSPTNPSEITVTPGVGSTLFGAGVPDLAVCLQSGQDPACFLATRESARTTAGATAPTVPTNFVATVSGGTVTLNWTAPASGDPVVTYVLEAGSSAGAANLANFPTGTTSTSYVAVGVGVGIYYVRVRAQNAGGTSGASLEVVVVVGTSGCTSLPNPPSGLAATVSGSTVTFTWSAPAGACAPTSYVLQAGSSSGLSNLANSSTGTVSTSFVATGVAPGTYYVRVLAANNNGRSAASNEVVATVGASTRNVDQFYLPQPFPTTRFGFHTESQSLAQTFTVGIAGILSIVELDLIRGGTDPSQLVQIRPTSAGIPTSEVLLAVTIQGIPSTHQGAGDIVLVTVDLSEFGLRVQAGDRLAIVLPKKTLNRDIQWSGSGSGYPGGNAFADNGGNGIFTDRGGDFFFRTYVSN